MKQIILILQREFNTRVRKKSFIIMTLLTPLLFAGLMVLPSYLMTMNDTEYRNIAVVDETGQFGEVISSGKLLTFNYIVNTPVDSLKTTFDERGYYALLAVEPGPDTLHPQLTIYARKQPSIEIISYIENSMEKEIENRKLRSYNIENLDKIMEDIKTSISCKSIKISDSGEEKESSAIVAMGFAYVLGFIIYMMVLLTGNQVMQGVIEEKNDRVIEVIISSIKPFKMMMGKILGIASVSLLQIIVWIVLTIGLATLGMHFVMGDKNTTVVAEQTFDSMGLETAPTADSLLAGDQGMQFIAALQNQNYSLIIGSFIFFFLFGYLMYAAMYAAAGSAVENINDTQQLVLPMTIPMILALFVMLYTMKSPDGPLAVWCSIIPFTSPIVMMARITFGVPMWQLLLSGGLLLLTFVAFTLLAAKIYRVGILMHGKKPTWKEIWKWMKYKY